MSLSLVKLHFFIVLSILGVHLRSHYELLRLHLITSVVNLLLLDMHREYFILQPSLHRPLTLAPNFTVQFMTRLEPHYQVMSISLFKTGPMTHLPFEFVTVLLRHLFLANEGPLSHRCRHKHGFVLILPFL